MAASEVRQRTSGGLSSVQDNLAESAKRQVNEVTVAARDAVSSGTWAYPLLVSDE
jgi:hypothetical protein